MFRNKVVLVPFPFDDLSASKEHSMSCRVCYLNLHCDNDTRRARLLTRGWSEEQVIEYQNFAQWLLPSQSGSRPNSSEISIHLTITTGSGTLIPTSFPYRSVKYPSTDSDMLYCVAIVFLSKVTIRSRQITRPKTICHWQKYSSWLRRGAPLWFFLRQLFIPYCQFNFCKCSSWRLYP